MVVNTRREFGELCQQWQQHQQKNIKFSEQSHDSDCLKSVLRVNVCLLGIIRARKQEIQNQTCLTTGST